MKFTLLFLLLISSPVVTVAQKVSLPDQDEFIRKHYSNLAVVQKMLAYDRVAWVSSDSIQTLSEEELKTYGGQWFCYRDSTGQYHALYGAYDSVYTLTAHYLVDSADFSVRRSYEAFDTVRAVQYSKAYNLALSRKKAYLSPDDQLRYNHFIFSTDSTVTVHFLPAFQPNGYMVYGAELHYTLNGQADSIIDRKEYFKEYRAYKAMPADDVSISYDTEFASIGGLFFLLYYEPYFQSIELITRHFITKLFRNEKGEGSWMHATRELPDK